MPAVVHKDALILVTGATGFIATHTVAELLKRGFSVRGTVRSAEKGKFLENLFREAGRRFQYIIVEDIQREGGFDDAVKGVDGILHIASPLYRTAPTGVWENIIEPAKRGTTNILSAASRYNPNVKRIVITSSYAAAADSSRPSGTIFTAEDWDNSTTEYALKKGKDLEPMIAYFASKVWAEKVAWDFMEREKPSFDITTILPPLVCGPALQPITTPKHLNTSNFELWNLLTGVRDNATKFSRNNPPMPMVDVRDVAWAHVEALLRPEAGNRRIPVSHEFHRYQECLDVVHSVPELANNFPNASWGESGNGPDPDTTWHDLDASVSREILEMKYRDWKETIIDAVTGLVKRNREEEWYILTQ